jgi:hypothetical protein
LAATPTAAQRDVELVPFHQLRRRTYVAYCDVLTPAEYAVRTSEVTAERARVRTLEAATIAYVPAGEADGEKAFNMRGEDSSIVRADGRPERRAARWFSYDIGISAGTPARWSRTTATTVGRGPSRSPSTGSGWLRNHSRRAASRASSMWNTRFHPAWWPANRR